MYIKFRFPASLKEWEDLETRGHPFQTQGSWAEAAPSLYLGQCYPSPPGHLPTWLISITHLDNPGSGDSKVLYPQTL